MATGTNIRWVAIVEDDESYRSAIQRLLKAAGFSVLSMASAEDFLDCRQKDIIGCLIVDIRLPGMSGLDLQAKVNADLHAIPIIFITAHAEERTRAKAMRNGALKFLAKPFDGADLIEGVRVALGSDN